MPISFKSSSSSSPQSEAHSAPASSNCSQYLDRPHSSSSSCGFGFASSSLASSPPSSLIAVSSTSTISAYSSSPPQRILSRVLYPSFCSAGMYAFKLCSFLLKYVSTVRESQDSRSIISPKVPISASSLFDWLVTATVAPIIPCVRDRKWPTSDSD